jgi:hypothetical protein
MKMSEPNEVAGNKPIERSEDKPMSPSERYAVLCRHAMNHLNSSRRPGLFDK